MDATKALLPLGVAATAAVLPTDVSRGSAAGPTPPAPWAMVTDLKAGAHEPVTARRAPIVTLSGPVKGAAAACGHNADARGQLSNACTGLQAIAATLQAETQPQTAV